MISVIVPVLNESQTIAAVVDRARRSTGVGEVIVVDDGSVDGTPQIAQEAGAKVITSTLLGKGASMEDGLCVATHELLAYLDGDLSWTCDDLIERLTRSLIEDRADFVKARFSRAAGRVTMLTARPLILTFFPELGHIEQPLGGIIAARRSLLRELKFETDYGVDIGLLLDAAARGARIEQVDIGHIEHDSHSLEVLGDMAKQVVRVLLERAARYRRLTGAQVKEVEEVERHAQAELSIVLGRLEACDRLALFDMDGVLVNGRYIVSLAERVGKTAELGQFLDNAQMSAGDRCRAIAGLFAGVPATVFEETARAAPLVDGAVETVVELRKRGYRVGILTDSFRLAAETVRRRVFADFSIAHLMRFRKGIATGTVTLSPALFRADGCPEHELCKLNAMLHICERAGIGLENVLAVGDNDNDVCMLKRAGVSVAFEPKTEAARNAGQRTIHGSLSGVLAFAPATRDRSD